MRSGQCAVVTAVAADYPDVTLDHLYVDNAAMQLVRNPGQFDVIVTDNLFGDIITDLAAAVTGGMVRVPLWPHRTTQAGDAIREILVRMGAEVTLTDVELTVQGPQRLHGIDIDMHDVGELTPTVAALAAGLGIARLAA